ncbi:hypothetical protein C2G38_2038789 [Gigaspora rosea]|uniref:OTU domain-containing protein n=1 Tax=Gigaspora rosea TaxID=44941 RepID=A0A397V3I9_9GLOM|nr:hypothetical protein C2G38_2038789 [Gigaspora rosea]
MHFGATTTQRVEGAHSAMKHAIESSGSLTRAFNSLDRWLRLHHEENSLQYENESISIDPLLTQDDKDRLEPLLGKVSQFALNTIKNELLRTTTYEACLCELRVNYNIPCCHMLPAKGPVILSSIPKRWLLFPDRDQLDSSHVIQNTASINTDNFISLKSKLYTVETRYMNFLDEQQKSALLNQLDDILTVPEVKLSDIKVPERIKGKGRPSGTKRLPTALERMEQEEKKRKMNDYKNKKKPKDVKKELTKSTSFSQCISELHIEDQNSKILLSYRIPANDIDQVYNPLSDGNCGFRALAFAIRGNEENWDLIKLAMNNQLNKRIEIYKDWLGYNVELLKQILESRASPCEPSLWFLSPDCAQLAASTFSVPIAIFDERNEQSMLFFPLETPPVHRRNPIILHFINGNHIIYVGMKSYTKVNWPVVNVQHATICRKYGLEDHWSRLFV